MRPDIAPQYNEGFNFKFIYILKNKIKLLKFYTLLKFVFFFKFYLFIIKININRFINLKKIYNKFFKSVLKNK